MRRHSDEMIIIFRLIYRIFVAYLFVSHFSFFYTNIATHLQNETNIICKLALHKSEMNCWCKHFNTRVLLVHVHRGTEDGRVMNVVVAVVLFVVYLLL